MKKNSQLKPIKRKKVLASVVENAWRRSNKTQGDSSFGGTFAYLARMNGGEKGCDGISAVEPGLSRHSCMTARTTNFHVESADTHLVVSCPSIRFWWMYNAEKK